MDPFYTRPQSPEPESRRDETYPAVASEPPVGDVLFFGRADFDSLNKRYILISLLGGGTFGEVVRARDLTLDREVALKFLRPHGESAEILERFLKEARAAARVQHPNIVTLFDIYDGSPPFLSMEYVDGITLYKLLEREKQLPVWQARDYVRQLAVALQHIHENGLVHRDIKPANVMVTARDQIKVLDLGIARFTPRAGPTGKPAAPHAPSVPNPAGGAVGPALGFGGVQLSDEPATGRTGTPRYMAPEQWATLHVDIRADLYALGCVFHELLTGKPPFSGTMLELEDKHLNAEPPRVEDLRPEVPASLGAIIRKMLAKDPNDRFATPEELICALDAQANPPAAPKPGTVSTVAQFAHELQTHRVLPAKQIDELYNQLLPKHRDLRPLVDDLIGRGWLTQFQVEVVLRGAARELVVGGYVLQTQLGEGQYGIVYRAKQFAQNRDAAVKVIRPQLVTDKATVTRFRNEIAFSSALHHPNIAAVYAGDEDDGRLYLAMELCAGESLQALVERRGAIPWREVCEWTKQTTAGLQHIHEKKLIHRDLKPSNLILTPAGVKILDLGLAKAVAQDARKSSAGISRGEIGTANYMSPEQALAKKDIDIRSDLYNLGATVYHLLTGAPMFQCDALTAALISQVSEIPTPIAERQNDVSPELAVIVHKLVEKKPADRYQTPAELLAALQSLPA